MTSDMFFADGFSATVEVAYSISGSTLTLTFNGELGEFTRR